MTRELTSLHRLHLSGEGDVVVDDLTPGDQHHGDSVVVEAVVFVQMAGHVPGAGQRVASRSRPGSVHTWWSHIHR